MTVNYPRISVCITHYNRPEKLGVTLESLLRQTRMPDEIFLWDDCSPKDPSEIVSKWPDKFPHFKYYRNQTNLNMPGNLNEVLSQATGDFIANLHDADEYHPRLIELWLERLIQYPSAGMVYCGLESPRPGNAPSKLWLNSKILPLNNGRDFFKKHFLYKWSSPIWGSAMVRKDVYRNLLPFDKRYHNWSDVGMWMRIAIDYDIAYVDLPLIKTDEEETPRRGFNWNQVFIQYRMTEEGIKLYCEKKNKSPKIYLFIHYINLQLRWFRHMASGVLIRDWRRIRNGGCNLYLVVTNAVPPVKKVI